MVGEGNLGFASGYHKRLVTWMANEVEIRSLEIFLVQRTLKHQQNIFSVSGGHITKLNLSSTNRCQILSIKENIKVKNYVDDDDDDAFLWRIMLVERGIHEISSLWLHLKWELNLRMPPLQGHIPYT
jgi:hypothetical protein